MRFILVIERKHLFPGLSPQGFLTPAQVDLESLADRMFFAQRDFMEINSHFKQIIPYLFLQRGQGPEARVLAYQRHAGHTEKRLGGLWSLGFGGHIEPPDQAAPQNADCGLVRAAALREMAEETGLRLQADDLQPIGFINSDQHDVSSVHFGVVYRARLDNQASTDVQILSQITAQAEPYRACWVPIGDLPGKIAAGTGPEGGSFEDWSRIVIGACFSAAGGGKAERQGTA